MMLHERERKRMAWLLSMAAAMRLRQPDGHASAGVSAAVTHPAIVNLPAILPQWRREATGLPQSGL
ncbi:MAG: hypothetical protein AB7F78_16365 [Hyphomicrobiaceae bacterium]